MSEALIKEFLEAGVHFGHQTKRWNPKMKPYIFGARNGIYIIDLAQSVEMCVDACQKIEEIVASGKPMLFVGTKRQAQDIIAEEAVRAEQFYMAHRWLGGTLTNFKTVRRSIDTLKQYETMKEDGSLDELSRKEANRIDKRRIKLDRALSGIRDMGSLPGALFVVDTNVEALAIHEANLLGIPVFAIVDTNCDPDVIDYLIPGNDDAIRSIKLITQSVADACLKGLKRREQISAEVAAAKEAATKEPMVEEKEASSEAEVKQDSKGPKGVKVETRIRLAEDLMPEAAKYAEEWDGTDKAQAPASETPAAETETETAATEAKPAAAETAKAEAKPAATDKSASKEASN